ncbi:MAG: hypothetical protein JNJ73_07315 [Hyphomonadaceae bacterium]|nr:hypothetical protein [Hyphomonadaceae bacterium]
MRRNGHWGFLTALVLAFAPSAARADAVDARVGAALRAGDSAAAANALIEAVERALGGGSGLSLTREGLSPVLARELEFFAGRELRAAPPQFVFARAARSELQGGIQQACASAADLAGARVTASRFQTSAAPGAAIASCAFESQQDEDFRWIGVVIRTQGDGGVRLRASFTSADAAVRRTAAQHLSMILASLANAVQGPTAAPARPPARRDNRTPQPAPGTTI